MTGTISIRPIEQKDVPVLAAVYLKALQNAVHERWTQAAAYKLLDHWLNRQPDLAFVAQDDDISARWQGNLRVAMTDNCSFWKITATNKVHRCFEISPGHPYNG